MNSSASTKARGGAFPGDHRCAAAGCDQPGNYRAPCQRRARQTADQPPQWQYFCLQHIREFNAGWNYFDGMDADEIWRAQTAYPHWEQAARSFARTRFSQGPDRIDEALGVLRWKTGRTSRPSPLSSEDRQALATLGLSEGATLTEAKAAFRRLARRYHPDTNAGSRDHETRFRQLTHAMAHLQQSPGFRRWRGKAE